MATAKSRRLPTGQFLLGAIVVLVGVLLLLHTTDTVQTGEFLLYVPSLFVLLGVWILVQSRLRSLVGPVVLIGVTGAWQLVALGFATVDQVVVYWPVFLIALGLSIALGQFRSTVTETKADLTSGTAVFGGVEKRNTSKAFTGGELTALFGGTTLDLRDAAVAEGPARIDATAMFGEVEIVVPRDWNVRLDVVPVLGGASDDRPRSEHDHDEIDLIVTGFAAFGGISITD